MITAHQALEVVGAVALVVLPARWIAGYIDHRAAARHACGRLGNLYQSEAEMQTVLVEPRLAGWLRTKTERVLAATLLVFASFTAASTLVAYADPAPAVEVHFSPHGGCTKVVTDLIDAEKYIVRLAGYQFTSEPIAQAVIHAHGRHVDVQVIVDRSSGRSRQVSELRAAGVTVLVDSRHHIFHDKYVVAGDVVETGSFNYTDSAEKSNAENCLVLRNAGIARQYAADWLGHSAHAQGGGS